MIIIILKFEKGTFLLYRQKDIGNWWSIGRIQHITGCKGFTGSDLKQKKENLEETFIRDKPSWMVIMSLIYEFSLWRIQPLNWIAVWVWLQQALQGIPFINNLHCMWQKCESSSDSQLMSVFQFNLAIILAEQGRPFPIHTIVLMWGPSCEDVLLSEWTN